MKTAALVLLGLTAALLPVRPAQAQYAPLDEARTAYQQGEFDRATDLFSELADVADPAVRKEALQHLGRLYVAQNMEDRAREALTELLDLQPPLIELDPDVEPPPLMTLYYEVRKNYGQRTAGEAASYTVPTADPGLRTLAVMDFRNYAMEDHERFDPMQWGLSSMMIEQLGGATDLKLVDRENLQWILGELDLQSDLSRVDQSTAVRMGRLLGAHAMVFGGIYLMGKTMRLSARVVKVETGEILLGESVEGRQKDFFELLEALSLKVSQALNSEVTETEIGSRTETRSLDAMLSYSQGLSALDQGDYRTAYEKFLEALDYDPSYARAKQKAQSLEPMLAAAAGRPSDTGGSLP
ncbi:MAG: CsgG/HfaB family protein [Rhodothermales bacterium]|nr:CsgG/HfaB family protein [Rhodothermales bacterium]